MKTRNFIISLLLVIGFISASLSSVYSYSAINITNYGKNADTTDSNGGGIIIPPIGH